MVLVVAGGGPKPHWRELSPVLPRHARPCGDLQNGRPTGRRDIYNVKKELKAYFGGFLESNIYVCIMEENKIIRE